VEDDDEAKTTLIFTTTRSQCELWYQALLQARSDWLGDPEHRIAIHHGSLERDLRLQVEAMLDAGELRAVVCTSSLDLGVDFPAVDQVIQLGSPKGVARLMQRAGRSGHQPGAISRVWCVPTYAFELVEFAAAREAAQGGRLESRPPLRLTLDVLAQHLVTVALGGGFHEAQMRKEVRQSHAFAELTDEQWGWVMDFITRGGPSLTAYPQFAKVERDDSGFCRVPSQKIARMHRLAIGTITSDSVLKVKFVGGKQLGTIEENFISKVHPGDRFVFAGRTLELVRVREMTAQVRSVRGKRAAVPRWYGGRFPLSTRLAEAVRQKLQAAGEGIFDSPEMQRMAPLVELQRRWSRLPRADELMIETTRTRDGHHHFLYPFEGRLVHEGLGSVLAHRLTKQQPRSVELTVTDYGIELLTAEPLDFDEAQWRALLSPQGLTDDLVACLNAGELTKRQFRDIARIAGLITPGYPGLASKSNRQLQASAELFYDVFLEFDPDNLLMEQARREVLEEQLESRRIRAALDRLGETNLLLQPTPRLTPLAFPIWAERLRTQTMSSESWTAKVTRMVEQLEAAADAG